MRTEADIESEMLVMLDKFRAAVGNQREMKKLKVSMISKAHSIGAKRTKINEIFGFSHDLITEVLGSKSKDDKRKAKLISEAFDCAVKAGVPVTVSLLSKELGISFYTVSRLASQFDIPIPERAKPKMSAADTDKALSMYRDGVSYSAIAKALSVDEETVKDRINKRFYADEQLRDESTLKARQKVVEAIANLDHEIRGKCAAIVAWRLDDFSLMEDTDYDLEKDMLGLYDKKKIAEGLAACGLREDEIKLAISDEHFKPVTSFHGGFDCRLRKDAHTNTRRGCKIHEVITKEDKKMIDDAFNKMVTDGRITQLK